MSSEPRFHVAFVATPDLSYISGSSLSLRYTVEALAQKGARCTVLCQHAPADAQFPGVEYVEVPMPLDYQIITDTRPTNQELHACGTLLADALMELPDVDLVHAIYGTFTGMAAAWAAAVREVPLVVSTFGRDVTFGADCDERYRRMMSISYSQARLVFASDSDVADLVEKHYTGRDTEVRLLPPAVNFDLARDVARRTPDRPRGARLVAVQSSFNEKKGLRVLVEAVAELAKTIPDVELVVVGHDDTPDRKNEARLRDRAAELGISDRIHYTGHLDHASTIGTIAGGDVLVDPRSISSFSSCVYEAMTVGVPVVASDVACNRLALEHGGCGLLVPPNDPTLLAAAVRSVVVDPSVAERLRVAGLERSPRADHETGAGSVAADLVAAYARVLA